MNDKEPLIAITMDTDWAPEQVVRDAIELVRSAGSKATVFCTNSLEIEADEIAIHPNFTDMNDLTTPLEVLRQAFPSARGVRSHSLFFTERFRPLYKQFNLAYDANSIQYLARNLQVTKIAGNTVSIPMFFMDRFHMEMAADKPNLWSLSNLEVDTPGLKVFDFHPIHIFLNTPNVAWYERAKTHYHDVSRLREHIAPSPGTRTLLVELLNWIRDENHATWTLSEIEQAHCHPFSQRVSHASDRAWQ